MNNIDLPKRPDGRYLDLYALFHQNDEQSLHEYAKRIKETYKIDEFEIQTESHGLLKFHRGYTTLDIDRIKDDIIYDVYDDNKLGINFNFINLQKI